MGNKLNLHSLATSETIDMIVIADEKGIAVRANQAYLDLTGLEMEDVMGRKPDYLS